MVAMYLTVVSTTTLWLTGEGGVVTAPRLAIALDVAAGIAALTSIPLLVASVRARRRRDDGAAG